MEEVKKPDTIKQEEAEDTFKEEQELADTASYSVHETFIAKVESVIIDQVKEEESLDTSNDATLKQEVLEICIKEEEEEEEPELPVAVWDTSNQPTPVQEKIESPGIASSAVQEGVQTSLTRVEENDTACMTPKLKPSTASYLGVAKEISTQIPGRNLAEIEVSLDFEDSAGTRQDMLYHEKNRSSNKKCQKRAPVSKLANRNLPWKRKKGSQCSFEANAASTKVIGQDNAEKEKIETSEISVPNRRRLALSVLRDQCLQVITHWYMGQPFSEIAHNMNLNPDSVRHILHVWYAEKRLACHKPGQGKIKGKVITGKGQVPSLWKWRFLVAAGSTSVLQCMVCDKRLNSAKMDNIACHIRNWHPYSAELPQRVRRAIHKAWKMRQGLHKILELQANYTEKHELIATQNEQAQMISHSQSVQQPEHCPHVQEIKNTVNDSRLCNPPEDYAVEHNADNEEMREFDTRKKQNIPYNMNKTQQTPSKKQKQMRYFQDQWRQKYLVDYDWKAEEVVCLVCGLRMRCLRSCTFARHAQRRHPESMHYSKEIRNGLWESWHKGQHRFPLLSAASGSDGLCSKKTETPLDLTTHREPETALTSDDAIEQDTTQSPCTREEEPAEESPSTSHSQNDEQREFTEDWCKELTWLNYDQNTGLAICEICASFPEIADQSSMVVKGFPGPFKLETLKEHAMSFQHKKCVEAKQILLTLEATPLPACIEKMDEGMFNHMNVLFNVAYYIAKNNRPYTDFEGLLELTWKLGVAVREEYANDKRCKEFISHIATVIRKELICELKEAKYVSLLLDRLIDKGGIEELILYVRYVKNDRIKEAFLSVLPLEMATADGYLETITKELKMHGLLDWLSSIQLIGIGTDGAASMIGDGNGLVQKVRQNLSHVIGIHSIAHALILNVLSSVKEGKCIDEIDSVLKKLYQFYQHSPKRLAQLKQVADGFNKKIQMCQYMSNVRRVSIKVGFLSALVKEWKCVTSHLESLAAEKDNASAVAKSLFKKLTDYKFVYMLHFLLDYLEILNKLSILFKTEELFLNAIEVHVKDLISSLNSLKDVPEQHEEKFINGTSSDAVYQDVQLHGLSDAKKSLIQNEKDNLIQHGIKYLEERFLNQSNIERSTAVFDTFTWPSGTALEDYGVDDITELARHFQKQLLLPEMDDNCIHAIHNEWTEFKTLGTGKKLSELLDLALSSPEKFPVLGNLLCIVSVLPVSTTCCERGFNLMNLVKQKFRSSMQQESLGDLLMINMNGPSVHEFDALKAVDHWYFNSKNSRHVHGHKKPCEKSDMFHKTSGLQEFRGDYTENPEMATSQAVQGTGTHIMQHDGPPVEQRSQNGLSIQEQQDAIGESRLKNQTEDDTACYKDKESGTKFKQSYFQQIRNIHTRRHLNTPEELKKKQSHKRNFQEHWRHKYMVDYDSNTEEAVCILCGVHMRSLRSCTFQRHARRHSESLHYPEEIRNNLWKSWNKGERIYPLRIAGANKSGINLLQDYMESQTSLPENPDASMNTEEYMAKQQEQIESVLNVLKLPNSQNDESSNTDIQEQM